MDDKTSVSPSPSVLWPTLLTIVLGLYGYTKFRPRLDSARPKDTPGRTAATTDETEATARFPARLWEDPLGDQYRAELQKNQPDQKPHAGKTSDGSTATAPSRSEEIYAAILDLHERSLLLPVMVPGGVTANEKEARMRTRYAVTSALATAVYQPTSQAALSCFVLPAASKEPARKGQKVLVPYELFRPDNCRRTYGFGKEAKYTDVVVCWLPDDQLREEPLAAIAALRSWANAQRPRTGDRGFPIDVRVIGPDSSDALLTMVREWTAALTKSRPPVADASTASAPNGSSDGGRLSEGLNRVEFYSTGATIEPYALKRNDSINIAREDIPPGIPVGPNGIDTAISLKVDDCNRFLGRVNASPAEHTVIPVIGTDWHLALAIRKELNLRYAWPEKSSHDDYIAIVTEKDTLYGRSIPFLFASLLDKTVKTQGDPQPPLLVYKFFRGIDGSVASGKPASEAKKDEENDPQAKELGPEYAPEGNYQIDYLRRLAEVLVQRDREMKLRGGHGIRAIGVVGTDVFDKLLVLRALRKRFPRTWFFTNDLDENFCRSSEIEYTQNLLVASHFGLELHPSLQRDVPPFRDSYQTATFLGVLMAVRDQRTHDVLQSWRTEFTDPAHSLWPVPEVHWDEKVSDFTAAAQGLKEDPPQSEFLKPLVFEIGRHGAYQLTKTGDQPDSPLIPVTADSSNQGLNATIHPPSSRELSRPSSATWGCLILGSAALVMILAVNITSIRRGVFYLLRPLQSVLGFFFARRFAPTTYSDIDRGTPADGKPLRTNSDKAVDVWNALAAVLILVVCVIALSAVWIAHANPEGQPFSLFAGISVWPSVILRILAAVLSIAFMAIGLSSLKRNQKEICGATSEESPTKWAPQSIGDWFREAIPKWLFGRGDSNTSQEDRLVQDPYTEFASWPSDLSKGQSWCRFMQCVTLSEWPAGAGAEGVLKAYFWLGWPSVRVIRALALVALYLVFGFALAYGTDSLPNRPVRGPTAWWADLIALLFSSFGLLFITFFVIDALRLSQRFVRLLGRQPAPWPEYLLGQGERDLWGRIRSSLEGIKPAQPAQESAAAAGDVAPCVEEVDGLAERQAIHAIAKVTDTLNKMIWFPFIVMLLLVVARQRMFDGWDYPLSLVVLQLLLLVALYFHTWRLRIEADDARKTILQTLRDALRITTSAPARHDHLVGIIDEVERQQSGAFSHWTQDYFLKAMTLPFLGGGGIVLLDQFLGSK